MLKLIKFESSLGQDANHMISIHEYTTKYMKTWQTEVFYAISTNDFTSSKAIQSIGQFQRFKKLQVHGICVLIFSNEIDKVCLEKLKNTFNVNFCNIESADIDRIEDQEESEIN